MPGCTIDKPFLDHKWFVNSRGETIKRFEYRAEMMLMGAAAEFAVFHGKSKLCRQSTKVMTPLSFELADERDKESSGVSRHSNINILVVGMPIV